ncbi:MAG TPA: AAA family ATPase [Gammaproteobacteria bacterium]|nr:AAA family ATPase [Gammaproteobacteria bacterium]
MYAAYFGLNDKPFSITPDPRYLFLSGRHTEALAHLLYGVTESGGFIQLTGEVGTGKTTLIRSLLEKLPDTVDAALIINPRVSIPEFLRSICRELHIACTPQQSSQELIDALNARLLEAHAKGRRVVLIIDEAQALTGEVLEQVRLLTNLETSRQKLLQIILVGQPELRELLARTELRQLAQRVTGRYHLEPLSPKETRAYVHHRLNVAGAIAPIFTMSGLRAVQRVTEGIPRLINIICDRALLGAFTRELRQVDAGLIRHAAREVLDNVPTGGNRKTLAWLGAAAVILLSTVTLLAAMGHLGALLPDKHSLPAKIAAAPAIVKSAPALTASGWLADTAHPTDTDTAFNTLFSLWGTHYVPGGAGSGCEEAQSAGLHCLYRKGTWNNLRSFDRPAIITLTDAQGIPHQVVVTELDADSVTLQAGAIRMHFPISELDPLWYGDYLLLWKPNPNAPMPLKPGMIGTAVGWLRTQLSTLEHLPNSGSSTYDTNLMAAVKQFQASQHLKVDGIAGEETLIHLNTALNVPGTPHLTPPGN